MIVEVEHIDDAAVQAYRDLPGRDCIDGPMVIEGVTALTRLLSGGHALHSVLATPAALARIQADLPPGTLRLVAPPALLRRVVGYAFHRGVLALAPRPATPWPQRLYTVVVAQRVTDPANIGALTRNARVLGAEALLCDAAGGDPFSRRAIRASMGSCFHLPVVHAPVLPYLQQLRREHPDLRCVAATCAEGAPALPGFVWPACCALLMGNEGYGLSPDLLALADAEVRIPMAADTDSLNVAAASAVLLYGRMQALDVDGVSR